MTARQEQIAMALHIRPEIQHFPAEKRLTISYIYETVTITLHQEHKDGFYALSLYLAEANKARRKPLTDSYTYTDEEYLTAPKNVIGHTNSIVYIPEISIRKLAADPDSQPVQLLLPFFDDRLSEWVNSFTGIKFEGLSNIPTERFLARSRKFTGVMIDYAGKIYKATTDFGSAVRVSLVNLTLMNGVGGMEIADIDGCDLCEFIFTILEFYNKYYIAIKAILENSGEDRAWKQLELLRAQRYLYFPEDKSIAA